MSDAIELGDPIAVGRTAEIYAWGEAAEGRPARVLKLTRAGFPPHLADQEYRSARLAWELGAPAPQAYELVEVDASPTARRRGVVLERVDGPTMAQGMKRAPWRIPSYGRQMGRLHAALHTVLVPAAASLPSYRDKVGWHLGQPSLLPDEVKLAVWQGVQRLPEGETLCHADFHPENLVFAARGTVVIDWEGSVKGPPVADVASTVLWIRSALTFGQGVEARIARRLGERMERSYLREYERLAPGRLADLDAWIGVLAACRADEEHRRELPHLQPLIARGCAVDVSRLDMA